MENTTPQLSVLEQLTALAERRQFFLVQASLHETAGSATVVVQPDTRVATTPAGRKEFERDTNAWRFAAGGGLVILDCLDQSVALVRYRDRGAPSYGDHWTLGSGLSGSVAELLRPDTLAIREACEEFVIAGPKGILVPAFDMKEYSDAAFLSASSARHLMLHVEANKLFSTSFYETVPALLSQHANDRELNIAFGSAFDVSVRGVVLVDDNTRGIDLLKTIRMRVPYKLSEIAVFDGEEDREGRPLNAPVGCLRATTQGAVTSEFVTVFQNGAQLEQFAPFNNRCTPVLRAML